jgi:hypothetical protein
VPARVRDLSLTGARVEVEAAAAVPPSPLLVVEVEGGEIIELRGTVRSIASGTGERVLIGLEFAADQTPARARLALALFGGLAAAPAPAAPAPRIEAPALGAA